MEYRSRGTDIHANPEQVSPWYVRINPNCNVPTLIHKGKPVVESRGGIQLLISSLTNAYLQGVFAIYPVFLRFCN